MSIGLAMRNIAFYTGEYDRLSTLVNAEQANLMAITARAGAQGVNAQNDPAAQQARQRLAAYMALQGMAKEFLEYWKQVIKDFLAMLKSFQELAQGAR